MDEFLSNLIFGKGNYVNSLLSYILRMKKR